MEKSAAWAHSFSATMFHLGTARKENFLTPGGKQDIF
jgi:hypothetical protein